MIVKSKIMRKKGKVVWIVFSTDKILRNVYSSGTKNKNSDKKYTLTLTF